MSIRSLVGDCRALLPTLPVGSIQCVVTSPPYYGLRDYGVAGQIGLEREPAEFIQAMVAVFREVRRVLRDDGILFLNLGDSYAGSGKSSGQADYLGGPKQRSNAGSLVDFRTPLCGLKPKDLIGIPWRVALALQADGWWLRQALPWVKRNPMPESTDDRPTNAVEYVFQLTKAERYFYDYAAVQRIASTATHARLAQAVEKQIGSVRANGGAKTNGAMKAVRGKQDGHSRRHAGFNERYFDMAEASDMPEKRALRNSDLFFDSLGPLADDEGNIIALDVTTQPFKGAHFATFPPKLIEPLILAGCPIGGTVLDPFAGAGTTGLVADRLGRNAVLIELSPAYAAMAKERIADDAGLFADMTVNDYC